MSLALVGTGPVPGTKKRLGAIDVGSNSIRLLVAEYDPAVGLTVIDEVKDQPRLAQGLAATGRLDPAAIERALEALQRMREVCKRRGVSKIAAVATSAVREAENGKEFVILNRQIPRPGFLLSGGFDLGPGQPLDHEIDLADFYGLHRFS